MMIRLIFVILLYIKHFIMARLYQFATSGYVTASTSWIQFGRRIKTHFLGLLSIEFKIL